MKAEPLARRLDIVCHRDLYCVAPIGLQQRAWKLIVDQDDAFVVPIGRIEASRDGPFITPCHTSIRGIAGRIAGVCSGSTPRKAVWQGLLVCFSEIITQYSICLRCWSESEVRSEQTGLRRDCQQ